MDLTGLPQAPLPSQHPAKRASPEPEDIFPVKRQRQTYRRYHRLQDPPSFGASGTEIPNESTSVDAQLNASIGRILSDVGFDSVEPVVLDSFRNNVEENILHFLSYVRHSMTSSRRVQPIPQDFEHALRYHLIPVDSLRPHLKAFPRAVPAPRIPSPAKKTSLLTPPPETDKDEDEPIPTRDYAFLGPELNAAPNDFKTRIAYIPPNFPRFPSKHTYQETPVFATKRETNPEKIREQAIEEGRLGEEALRKLTRASRDSQASTRGQREKSLWGRKNESMDSMFEKTLKALIKSHPSANGVDLGPIVNSSRVYWRKMAVPNTHTEPQRTGEWVNSGTVDAE